MKPVLALFLTILATPALAASVKCHEFAGDTICDDGSRSHSFAGTTTITKPGRKPVRCHTFAGQTTCED